MSKQSKKNSFQEYIALIKERYSPSMLTLEAGLSTGEVVHYPDCQFFKQMHCTCGLLDHLIRLGEGGAIRAMDKLYPNFYKEITKHRHVREFLSDHRREIERRMARTHAAFLRKLKSQDVKGAKKKGLYALAAARRDDELNIGEMFTDPVEIVWFMRDIEDQIEDLFYDTKALRNTPDLFTLIGEMKALLWRVYDLTHQCDLKDLTVPSVDLSSEGWPSLIWLNVKNSKMLRCYYDLGDNHFWINLSDIYTSKGRSCIFNEDKDFLSMMSEFLEIPYRGLGLPEKNS